MKCEHCGSENVTIKEDLIYKIQYYYCINCGFHKPITEPTRILRYKLFNRKGIYERVCNNCGNSFLGKRVKDLLCPECLKRTNE